MDNQLNILAKKCPTPLNLLIFVFLPLNLVFMGLATLLRRWVVRDATEHQRLFVGLWEACMANIAGPEDGKRECVDIYNSQWYISEFGKRIK